MKAFLSEVKRKIPRSTGTLIDLEAAVFAPQDDLSHPEPPLAATARAFSRTTQTSSANRGGSDVRCSMG